MTKTNKVVAINYAAKVDRLGELNALIAPLADEISAIKEELRASGYEVVEGTQYRVTIGATADKAYTDWQELAKFAVKHDRLQRLAPEFTEYKQALGAVRCVAKVR